MKLMSKYRNAASSVGQWPAFLNSANFIAIASALAGDAHRRGRSQRKWIIFGCDLAQKRDHLIVESSRVQYPAHGQQVSNLCAKGLRAPVYEQSQCFAGAGSPTPQHVHALLVG